MNAATRSPGMARDDRDVGALEDGGRRERKALRSGAGRRRYFPAAPAWPLG